jgi:acyl-CoA reductase-like NAD-dependent aldehyde dehydrogenase
MSSTVTTEAPTTEIITVSNPRTGEVLYSVEGPSPGDVEEVYTRARTVFETIRRMSVAERVAEIAKLRRYLVAHKEDIARQIAEEAGKCLTDALLIDLFPSIDVLDHYERHAVQYLADEEVKATPMLMGKKCRVQYMPMGPVLVISPWNYPFLLSFVPAVCAFVAGNPVIIKPAKDTPLKPVYERLFGDSGFLSDAIQVVYATRNTAEMLIDAKPAKIMFTGSVGVGRHIMSRAAEHLIPVELELGGKDPMLVFEDANLERAVAGALWGGFANAGQTCTGVERIYVQEGAYDRFVELLAAKAERIVTPDKLAEGADERDLGMGCMTTRRQLDTVLAQIEDARAKGARVLSGGDRVGDTMVVPPTVIADATTDMKVQVEETFGPVVTVVKFTTEDEAVRLANDSPYGLSASVWTADSARGERVARELEAGMVCVNNHNATAAHPGLPFGGVKHSGMGRYKGAYGLHSFSHVKAVVIDRDAAPPDPHWYPYSKEKFALLGKVFDTLFGDGGMKLVRLLPTALRLQGMAKKRRL